MAHFRLSVIIPTYNRRVLLAKVLDSLGRMEAEPGELEVIVSDDGSNDGTAEDLALRKDPYTLRVLRSERPQGPAAARNRGAEAAQGEILGFVDSDVIVQPTWWSAAREHFADPMVAGVEGATEVEPGSRAAGVFDHVVANVRGGNYLTCNMFYRRSVFQALGGFDERYLRANREDSDLAFSVLGQGGRIVFEREARVWHPVMPGRPTQFLREARYGFHEALLRRKHPKLYAQKLKWIDGRAFPVFYWGLFLGVPGLLLGLAAHILPLTVLGSMGALLGWAGSVYAKCRKRHVTPGELATLAPQFLIIPWLRLYWVLRGEWAFRSIGSQEEKRRQ